ncbi:hypothetical protein IK5_06186 [Bacillus cereus VD154]|uniref:Uncharacterized protein n=1 Tax=Bacillus cereus VD154 TaxID=1053238 RepID=A0A9W5NZ52_BACCE|nr:hypothetical protein IK5_06186 [Bacillus cereus VD154]
MGYFNGKQFEIDIILIAVGYYLTNFPKEFSFLKRVKGVAQR